jgi:hypothetical protein
VPLTTTLEDMRDAVRRTADVVAFTDKHPDARVNDLLNQGLGALSRLCRTTNPEFQPIASTDITTDGIETMFALPADFRSLLMVQYENDDERKVWLTPYELHERASLTEREVVANSLQARCYRVMGSNLELLPRPPDGHTATVWYATTMTQLDGDAETFDTMDRLDSYVIWWAAREIAMEREAWERHDRLTQKMSELEADIRILARSLDTSHPRRVVKQIYAARPSGARHRGRVWR